MKILHTADWHVGRKIRGRSRADEHREVLREIVAISQEREVDLVVVAGDLFDTATPSPESESIVYGTLLEITDAGAQVVLISGNHDNPRRLQAIGPLLNRAADIRTGAVLKRPDKGGIVKIETRSGQRAQVALMPFLSQRQIVRASDLMEKDADQHTQDYAARAGRLLQWFCRDLDADSVNMVVAHLLVTNAEPGGGERAAHTGFDYAVPSLAFPTRLHYVALGHIHKAQAMPATCPLWYCGSPLQLDFGDQELRKCVLLVEADPKTPARVEQVFLNGGRKLHTIRGSLKDVEALAEEGTDAYLRVLLEETARAGLADEVRDLLPNAVEVRLIDPETQAEGEIDSDLAGKSPHQLFAQFLAERQREEERLLQLFDQILEEVHETTAT